MSDFTNTKEQDGFRVKLWRGQRMCLIGMDVAVPEPDLVGFSIEVRRPGAQRFMPLRNRLNFSYDKPVDEAVDGFRNFPSTRAPFQKFRWVHFPYLPQSGKYVYRVTKKHMPSDNRVVDGTSIELDIPLDLVVYDNFLEVGFTRNFASSQAYADRYKNNPKIIPSSASQGLRFEKVPGDVYEWLGFEAYRLIFGFLNEVAQDPTIELDVFTYDLNEPDIVRLLEQAGPRVRAIIDNSGGHGEASSAESQGAKKLSASAGKDNVKRLHFADLQHHKVLIAKRGGKPFKVLLGSTNFSFRGLYIQANNALIFNDEQAAGLFGRAFEVAFTQAATFTADLLASQWHLVQATGRPPVRFCFSPHASSGLSLSPVGAAIDQATSSVFFSIAFLNQIKSGPAREAIDRLMDKQLFSYGIVDNATGLEVKKPNGSIGIVDFAYLAKTAPEPFKAEWAGGSGIHQHHKFVVTDFSLPTAKVFTGSSNLSPSGEEGNGDNLVMIEDVKVATAYAIEAIRVFDHLHFRSRMESAFAGDGDTQSAEKALTLQKPTAISGRPAWFEPYYNAGSQQENDRKLFSR
jgi:phosphatidylserine/phosphatidylglycerophosphate/cardiolipin synthase-like enzyme